MSETASSAVFLSYASQDAAAAQRIADALRAAGVEVWFDQNELVGGDAWDKKIRQQIKECALFVPVISANTQARPEGYFRLEWLLAVERSRLMSDDHPFLFPVVIDDTTDAAARVPERFRDVQWTRLNVKDTPESLAARVAKILGRAVGPVADLAPGRRPGLQQKRFGDPWMRRVGVIFALLIGLAYATRPLWKSAAPSETKPPTATQPASAAAPQTEAQKLVEKARKIFDESDELNRENYYLAEDLVERAIKLDPTEPSAWALHARISYYMVWQSIDTSEVRVEAMRSQAERAHALAPEMSDVVIAWADVRYYLRQDLPGVERDLLALAAREPKNWLVQRSLGGVYRYLGRFDDAIAAHRRAVELSDGVPKAEADLVNVLTRSHHLDEAEAAVTQALAKHTSGRLHAFDLFVRTQWRGDLTGAEAALAKWPDWLLVEDRGAILAWRTALWSKQPDKALVIAQRMQRDYLRDTFFIGPRAVLTARAHEMAGHREAALDDWRMVVQTADRVLASAPTYSSAAYWKAWALARLGDLAQAQALAAQMQQRNQLSFRASASNPIGAMYYFQCPSAAPLWANVGRPDLALAELRGPATLNDDAPITRAMLELDPAFDPLRTKAGFKEIVAAAPAPKPKPDLPAVGSAKVDDKSVAVLAFDNRSDDKDAEYFSDGISEELINALGRVPGLTVKGRTSAFFFKGKNATAQEIAEKLGVSYLVRGSVRKAGGKVRITAQLSRAATDEVVWSSEPLERDLKDVFAVQDEIVGLVAKNLSLKLGVSSAAPTAAVNPEAFEYYLQGREAWNRRTREGYERAMALFARSIELDSSFARPYVGQADVLDLRAIDEGEIGTWAQRNAPVFGQMHRLLDRALALDPESAEAYASLGDTFYDEWQFPEALRAARKAVALNPNYSTGWHWLSLMLQDRGELDEALTGLYRAAQLDPLSMPIAAACSQSCRYAGRFSEALEFGSRALKLQPDASRALATRALALANSGRAAEALPLVHTLLQSDAGRDAWQTGMAVVRIGSKSEADELLAYYRRTGKMHLIAPLLAARGDREEFLKVWQSLPMRTNEPWFLWEPFVDDYRHDPRFLRALEQTGLIDAHARAQAWRAAHPPEKIPAK